MFAEDICINLNDTLTNMNCFNLYDKLTNMNCNNLNDKLEYIKSPCNKLQNFMIDEPKINNDIRLFNNTNTPLVLNSGNGSGSSNSMFSFFSIFNNLFSSNSFQISEKNNEDSFYNVKGFPIYLLIFITIIVNIFIAIILTPVISVGIFIIIFLILIVAMLLLYMLTK